MRINGHIFTFKGAHWAPLLFLFAALGCANDEEAVSAMAKTYSGALIEQQEVRIVYSDSGQTKITVEAGILEDYSEDEENPRQVFQNGFRLSLLNALGQVTGTVKANKAVRRLSDQKWILTGDVSVIQGKERSLLTDAMEWDRSEKRFYSESNVVIIDNGEEVRGKGFTAEEDLSQYTIFAVSGHFEGGQPE
ncbi:MAG TPA: LPS export ABC transporter periplasmic protein LptC [Cryomorphaceae bacterium]|nr:LPS export ABC transporter periplasmic protein LptC [Cryomorphaceae bacterium]